MTKRGAVALLLLTGPALAQSAAPFTVDGRGFNRLDDAAKAIGDGTGTIVVAPGTYKDCARLGSGNVTIRAATPSTAIFDGGACEGKATLVFWGQSLTVDGIVFQNIRVPDGNGAGIRLEHGDLSITRSTFRNSDEGILTGNDDQGTIIIERSTFSGLGGCDAPGGCSHGIYIGGYGMVTVSRVRFERGTGGHYFKSRAAVNDVLESSFDDTGGRATNYMIDLPAGSVGTIARNVFVQGKNKENYSAFIAVAAESRDNPSAGLKIEDNDASIAPGVSRNTSFVGDWSREPLKIGVNKLGPGIKVLDIR
jgi:Right handed beta helix region